MTIPNSNKALSDYQMFTRHCFFNGMSMKDASELWNLEFKNRNLQQSELIAELSKYFKENEFIKSSDRNDKFSTFLFTWSPFKYLWDDIDDCINHLETDGYFERFWSCGRSKKPKPGDRFFLLRQKTEPRGIMGSGFIISDPYKDYSPHNKSGWSRYVRIVFDTILNPEKDDILPRQFLEKEPFSSFHWDAQGSGNQVPSDVAIELEKVWNNYGGLKNISISNISRHFIEGGRQTTFVTSYERNPRARAICLEYHGYSCTVCGFNFENVYGVVGKQFIHVHHIIPISKRGAEYTVDAINDLRPVCPNCHAMLHKFTDEDFISIDDLKELIKRNSRPDS